MKKVICTVCKAVIRVYIFWTDRLDPEPYKTFQQALKFYDLDQKSSHDMKLCVQKLVAIWQCATTTLINSDLTHEERIDALLAVVNPHPSADPVTTPDPITTKVNKFYQQQDQLLKEVEEERKREEAELDKPLDQRELDRFDHYVNDLGLPEQEAKQEIRKQRIARRARNQDDHKYD
jgi:hypothetical protein